MTAPDPTAAADIAARFERLLESEGPHAALVYVNGLTDYRCTGVFRFEDEVLCVYYVDREQPEQTSIAAIPIEATYCCYVRLSSGVFTTADALADPRLTDHAARASVRAYCGVPVFGPDGEFLGTLCHFDDRPRDPERIDQALMQRIAWRLGRSGRLPL